AFGDPGEDYGLDEAYREGRMERIGLGQVMEKVREALERYGRQSAGSGQSAPSPSLSASTCARRRGTSSLRAEAASRRSCARLAAAGTGLSSTRALSKSMR